MEIERGILLSIEADETGHSTGLCSLSIFLFSLSLLGRNANETKCSERPKSSLVIAQTNNCKLNKFFQFHFGIYANAHLY